MVVRQFTTALERVDVKAFESVGQAFDPARHEAISQVETADQPAGTVVTEMQRGYTIGPRLLRPALVTVAKAPAGAATTDEGEKGEA
jgi:molecular chaperone GrpE